MQKEMRVPASEHGIAMWESDDEEFEASILELDESYTKSHVSSDMKQLFGGSMSSVSVTLSRDVPNNCSTPLQKQQRKFDVPLHLSTPNSNVSSRADAKERQYQVLQDSTNVSNSLNQPLVGERNSIKRKRKFPGPAGTLPKLTKDINLKQLKNVPAIQAEEVPFDHMTPSQNSQTPSVSENLAWKTLVADLDISSSHLKKHNIQNALSNASKKRLPDGKVPLLIVVIDAINKSLPDATAILRDTSGSMQGVLHRLLMKQYDEKLKIGSVMLLKQTSVFSPKPRRQYLNITPNNLLQIYYEDEKCSGIEKTVVTNTDVPLDTLLTQPIACTEPHVQHVVSTKSTCFSNSPIQTATTSLFTTPTNLTSGNRLSVNLNQCSDKQLLSTRNMINSMEPHQNNNNQTLKQGQHAGLQPKSTTADMHTKLLTVSSKPPQIHLQKTNAATTQSTQGNQAFFFKSVDKHTAAGGRLTNKQASTTCTGNALADNTFDDMFSDEDDFDELDMNL